MQAVEDDGPWHLYWRTEKEKAQERGPAAEAEEDAAGPRPVGPDRLRRVGAAPTPACSSTPPSTSGTPARPTAGSTRRNPCSRIHVPRRHGVQPRVAEPAHVLRRRRPASSTSRRTGTPSRLWTLVLEISVYMAQFPSRAGRPEVVRLPHARPRATPTSARCSWCRASRTTRPRAGRSAGRSPRIMHAGGLRHLAPRWPPRSGRSRATRPTATRMLRVIRNHRRAAYNAPAAEYEGLTVTPGRHRRPRTARRTCSQAARSESDRMLELGEKHGYRNAQVTVHRADRHHRPGHGLRHHRHRAGLRPGEVQEARRRRVLQDHQPVGPAGPGQARLHARGRSTTSSATAAGPRTLDGLPARQPGEPQGQGVHRRGARRKVEAAAARRVRAAVRLQPLDPRRRLPQATRSASRRSSSTPRRSTCSTAPRLHASSRSTRPTPTSAAP